MLSKFEILFFGDQSPYKGTVFKWFRQFMSGARMLEDDVRWGRMATTVTPEQICRVESLIKKDPKMTYADIQNFMKVSSGSLTRILHDCLGIRKHCARWVLHNLSEKQKRGRVDWCTHMLRKFDRGRSPRVWDTVTGDETWVYQYDPETKQQSTVWVYQAESPPVKLKRIRRASKQMLGCFFANFGHVATIPPEDRKTVTADWYVNHCLPKVFQAWCKRHPRTGVRGLLLSHDNARAHTVAVTLDFLAANDVQLVTHPPYSPDLAPCDWFLFLSAKRQLKGKQFQNAEDAQAFFEGFILDIPQSTWSGVIDNWLRVWSNVYKLRGVSSKNWSRQSGCKYC